MLHRIAFPVVSEWYQDGRQLESDGGSNGTDRRPSEPQSADICFWVLPYVAESAYLNRLLCLRLPGVPRYCALSSVKMVSGASEQG
jgi:hypothetical protein